MTEKEFWQFLEQRGKTSMTSGYTITGGVAMDAVGEYLGGHALLPKDYNNLTKEEIKEIGELLFQKNVEQKTKEAVLILLAHQVSEQALAILKRYNLNPDKGLIIFAELALDESLMWNE